MNNQIPNIVIVTHGNREYLRQTLPALQETNYPKTITIVANAPEREALNYLREQRPYFHRLVTNSKNLGYPIAANQGWRSQDTDYTVIVGDDCLALNPDWLRQLVEIANHCPEVGIVGHSLEPVIWPRVELNRRTVQIQPANLGGIYLIPRRTWELCGYFNEELGPYAEEDALYGWKVRHAGLFCAYVDFSEAGRCFEHIGNGQPPKYIQWKHNRRLEAIPIRDDLIKQYESGRPLNQ